MQRVIQKNALYRCDVCKAEYGKAAQAKNCEARPVEKKVFSVGDKVESITKRECGRTSYVCCGTVAAVIGPEPYDPEILVKGYGLDHGQHFFWYEVVYTCPVCKQKKRVRFLASSLKRINRP